MKKRLLLILAVVLTFTGVFGGLFAWQYLKRRAAFPADGYVIASEEYQDTVVCDYFSLGTTYRKTYDDRIVFTSAMGTREQVVKKSFLHYGDASLSSLKASMLADLDEVENGLLDFYYLAPEMVLSRRESGYTIDNNGTDLEFSNFLSLLDEDKFLVQSGGLMTVKLASGSTQELDSGYLEVIYPEENIVRLYNQESMWQSIAAGCQIVLANGVVIDLGERTVYDSKGTARFTIDDVAMDLASGGGIAVQSDSATEWVPPTFEFEVVDGADGVSGEDGAVGVDGENGRDGASGEEGMDNEDGEEGEQGEDGEEGEEGEEGDSGDTGADGAQGANGTNGNDGASGATGATGAGGGTAGGGAGAGSEIGSALGQVVIDQLEYDCSEVTFSFYAENESGAMQSGCYVEIIETATSRVIRRIETGEDADENTSLNPDINDTSAEGEHITLTVQGLSPDTEYQILIYCNYSVTTEGTQHDGTKVYASRKFYTSSEGVSMSLQSVNQTDVGIHLDKKEFSQVQSAKVYVSFEGADEQGNPKIFTVASDVLDLSGGKKDCWFTVLEDEISAVGLTSNIPYFVVLYTSNLTANASGVWEDVDGEPAGLKNGDVVKSGQQLSGRTLKAVPEFGKITCYQNSHGSYQVYLDTVSDPDNSVESYVYKIYEYTENEDSDPTKTLVKTLSTINSTGVELFVDEKTIQFNKTYIIECEATYFDNVKNYTALISGSLTTGTGEAIVTFIPAEVNDIQDKELQAKYAQFGVVGPTWMYGYLEVNTKLAGFDIEKSKEIMVQVSCGDDYTRTLHYDQCVENNNLEFFYDESVTDTEKCIYNANLGKLFLPVNLWGLKDDSYYTFSVNASIHYSDTTTATKNVGSAIYKTAENNAQNQGVIPFVLKNITSAEGDTTGKYQEMTFAVTVQNNEEWKENGYPIEVLSARAIEISTFDDKGIKNSSHIIDLYEYFGLTEQTPKPDNVWCDPELSPLARYLDRDTDYMKDPDENALILFDTAIFGSTAGFTSITADVTAVYDYTYKRVPFYPEMESSNMGYQNDLMFTSVSATYTQGKKPPELPTDWEAVTAVPIKNRSAFEAGSQTITNVLGNSTVDNALDPSVVRGYRLEAEYQSAEMEVVTYYLFKYDDWAYFNYCQMPSQNGKYGTTDYTDIILAAEAAEEAAPGEPVSYWKDRVLKVEINCKDKGFTNAPVLNVIYDESKKENGRSEEDRKKAVTTGPAGYYYKTDFLKRGQTYIAAFKVLDGYRRTEDEAQTAAYVYPDMDSRYGGGNNALLRSVPFRMDRQEPRVKLLWNHTEPDGSQEWKFFIYDPDEALGKITLKEEGVTAANTLTTWNQLITKQGGAAGASWKDGYVMVSRYGSINDTSLLANYVKSKYTIAGMGDDNKFPDVEMSGDLKKISARDIEKIFDDSGTYRKTGKADDGYVDMDAAGRSWQGTFTVKQPSESNPEKFIFLGRSLNDSLYLTDEKNEVKTGGLGWIIEEKPTLYTMAAAKFYQSKLYRDDDVSGKLRFIASMDNNNLSFKVAPTAGDLKSHIMALEITVWQSVDMGKEKYEELEKMTVAFDGESAMVPLGNLTGYAEDRDAYANVRAIYDTGMYGTAQVTYERDRFKINGQPTLSEGSDQIVLNAASDEEEKITLWEQETGGAPFYPYSLRRQEELYWYSDAGSNRPTTGSDSIKNSVWRLGDNTAAGSTDGLAKAEVQKWNAEGKKPGGKNTFGLKGKAAVGTGDLDEESKFKGTAVSGWNEKEVKKNLVFGNLGIADSAFEEETGITPTVKIIEGVVELNGKDGNHLETLQPGQAINFTTPRTNIATSHANGGYTTQNRTYNKVTTTFEIDQSSMPKLIGSDDAPPMYLPYVFVEVYEDTKESKDPITSGELAGYYIQNDGAGTLVDDLDYSKKKYVKGPESFYNELWGQAEGKTYRTGVGEQTATLGTAFANVAAIPISEWKSTKNRGSFTISNLQPRGTGYPSYSVRLYVLPLKNEDGIIPYDQMNDITALRGTIAAEKEYILDNARTNGGYSTALCYYKSQKPVWWKLTTSQPAGIGEGNVSATYFASGYNDKNVRIDVKNNGFVLAKDTVIEFRILDQAGNEVVLSNDEIIPCIGNYVPAIRKYTYYDEYGVKQERPYLTYGPQGSDTEELNSGGTSYTVKVADLINSNKLAPGSTYKLQVRYSHKDPTLVDLQEEYVTQGAGELYEKKEDTGNEKALWSDWTHAGISGVAGAGQNDPDVNKLILKKEDANVKSWQECKLEIPVGSTPFLRTANADFKKPAAGKGMDMTISLNVQDKDYVLGARNAAGGCDPGKFYVKVYRNNGTEASQKFGFRNEDGSYKLQDITKTPSGTYKNNQEYLMSYYVEVWGTTNSQKHTTGGTCAACGKTHDANAVDANGNILLATSKGSVFTPWLTMLDEIGIQFANVEFIYNDIDRKLEMIVKNGVGYEDLTGEAIVTVTPESGNASESYMAVVPSIDWGEKKFTAWFPAEARGKIKGDCMVSIMFHKSDGEPYQYASMVRFAN